VTLSLHNRVAIITGAGTGLGREHALLLARLGARVVVNDLGTNVRGQGSSTAAAREVVDEITARGGEAMANAASVTDFDQVQHMVAETLARWGRVDILVNNAGILRDKSFARMELHDFRAVLDVHLMGAVHCIKAVWDTMRARNYGRIILTTSSSGLFGNFGQANYGAAKMGLVGFTRVLAVEGAKNNIKANAIAPVALTRMTEDILGPLGDKLGPETITPVVTYLAHEDCPVSGEVYTVGGGHVGRIFIGVTPGYTKADLSPEDVRDHFSEIRDEAGYEVPANLNEELMLTMKALS
jgi:NAD(P)-dependent dehydrogenase (short-subunit alcohol dehydrogenase family)